MKSKSKQLYKLNRGTLFFIIGIIGTILMFLFIKTVIGFESDTEYSFLKNLFFYIKLFIALIPFYWGLFQFIENAKRVKEDGKKSLDTVIYDIYCFLKKCFIFIIKFFAWIASKKREIYFFVLFITLAYMIIYVTYLADPFFMMFVLAMLLPLCLAETYNDVSVKYVRGITLTICFIFAFSSFFITEIGKKPKNEIREYKKVLLGDNLTHAARNYIHSFKYNRMKINQYTYFLILNSDLVKHYEENFR